MLASTGVERTPVPPEGSYVTELFSTIVREILGALARGSERLRLPPWLSWALLALLLVLIALIVVRIVLARLHARRRIDEGIGGVAASRTAAPAEPRDAAGWRAELEGRLAAGNIPEALEALWWWLARSLAGGEVEPDWTSRDLLARSRRDDLRDFVRRIDAFTYGPRLPEVDDLRGLVGRLERALS
ncbi:MAG: hypothetical protein ACJ75H_02630 [Thermoanaerobaculia bacterium]